MSNTAVAAIEKNAPKVLAEVLPFLPSALAKIPAKFRAVLIAIVVLAGLALLALPYFGLAIPVPIVTAFKAIASGVGIVALGNVPANTKLTIGQAAAAEGEVLAQAQAALADVPLPGPVEAAGTAVENAAPVVEQVVAEVAPTDPQAPTA